MPKERAVKVKDVSDQFGKPAWEYSDGSVRGEAGHMIRQLPGTQEITAQSTHDMARIRRERKQAVIAAAANAAVERADYRTKYGDLAFVAALANTAYIKATTADDPKAIDAARFLLQETSLAEAKQAQAAEPNLLEKAGIIALAAELARRIVTDKGNYREQSVDIMTVISNDEAGLAADAETEDG